jgi:HPt (histidine-containing phosphotransfer) domain-containing protein
MSKYFVPQVPPELRAQYIRGREDDVRVCRIAREAGEFSRIREIAHRIKGNGTTFGYPELSAIGEALENAAMAVDAADVDVHLDRFAEWVATHASANTAGA